MSRFYLRLLILPLLIFTAALVLIRAQPYDDHDLRQLLLPEGCPAPCFMGIRPGVTTMDEAAKILQTSAWVAQIEIASANFDGDIINWTWSDQKPKQINQTIRGELWATQYSKIPVVGEITIYSNVQLGETRTVLSVPSLEELDTIGNSIVYFAYYKEQGLSFRTLLFCNVTEPFKSIVTFNIRDRLTSDYSKPVNTLRDVFRAC